MASSVGGTLGSILARRKLSSREASNLCGLSHTTLSDIINDRARINWASAAALEKIDADLDGKTLLDLQHLQDCALLQLARQNQHVAAFFAKVDTDDKARPDHQNYKFPSLIGTLNIKMPECLIKTGDISIGNKVGTQAGLLFSPPQEYMSEPPKEIMLPKLFPGRETDKLISRIFIDHAKEHEKKFFNLNEIALQSHLVPENEAKVLAKLRQHISPNESLLMSIPENGATPRFYSMPLLKLWKHISPITSDESLKKGAPMKNLVEDYPLTNAQAQKLIEPQHHQVATFLVFTYNLSTKEAVVRYRTIENEAKHTKLPEGFKLSGATRIVQSFAVSLSPEELYDMNAPALLPDGPVWLGFQTVGKQKRNNLVHLFGYISPSKKHKDLLEQSIESYHNELSEVYVKEMQ